MDEPQVALRKTTNHDEIRKWIEQRNGKPAQEQGTSGGEDENAPGVLRVAFADSRTHGSVEELSWERFFRKFEDAKLTFQYASPLGAKDYKFVPRHAEEN